MLHAVLAAATQPAAVATFDPWLQIIITVITLAGLWGIAYWAWNRGRAEDREDRSRQRAEDREDRRRRDYVEVMRSYRALYFFLGRQLDRGDTSLPTKQETRGQQIRWSDAITVVLLYRDTKLNAILCKAENALAVPRAESADERAGRRESAEAVRKELDEYVRQIIELPQADDLPRTAR